jgi:hypothetical protein
LTTLAITFRREGDRTRYRVNGNDVGEGDAGFDAVLALVRAHPDAAVTLLTREMPLGGQSLPAATPFAARFPELLAAVGHRKLLWSAE